jgi:hypothetical protein
VCGEKLAGSGVRAELDTYIVAQMTIAKNNVKSAKNNAEMPIDPSRRDYDTQRRDRAREDIPRREAIVRKWERWHEWIRGIKE